MNSQRVYQQTLHSTNSARQLIHFGRAKVWYLVSEIFLVLQKAFDSLDRQTLLTKLQELNIK